MLGRKKKKKQQVVKAGLSEEQMNLIAQAVSALQTMMDMGAMEDNSTNMMEMKGDTMAYEEDDDMMKTRKQEDETDDKEMEKSKVAKESEETASDDADDRVEGSQPDESDMAMTKIGKELVQLRQALTTIVNVVKDLGQEIKSQGSVAKSNSQAIEGILEGLNITESVMKAAETETAEVIDTGITTVEKKAVTIKNNDVLGALENVIKVAKGESVNDDTAELPVGRAGLATVMKSLAGGN